MWKTPRSTPAGGIPAKTGFLDFDGNSAGAPVYAVADGTVVFAGSDYPGRVVIVQHDGGIYSM